MHSPLAKSRQTPGQDGVFGKTLFSGEPGDDRAEWLVVLDEPIADLRTRIPVERRILFFGEPQTIKVYKTRYLNQFGWVVGPLPLDGYRGRHIRQHAALPWHYGPATWRELAADKAKTKTLSVFCSNKTLNVQQAMRIRFVATLKARFGEGVDHFGFGVRPLGEKAEGLAPYRFTVVLENNVHEGFWTEKLADAYLGHCFPIYSGGRIPPGDFDARARLDIDILKPGPALDAIEALIRDTDFPALEPLIREQRRRVMLEHNFFAVASRIIEAQPPQRGRLFRAARVAQSWG